MLLFSGWSKQMHDTLSSRLHIMQTALKDANLNPHFPLNESVLDLGDG